MTNSDTVLFTIALLVSAPVFAQDMSFFLTSYGPGDGANLGGRKGADAHCQKLAESAGSEGKLWRAYLSAKGVNARDRIGKGPWVTANGVTVAKNVDDLHNANVTGTSQGNSVTEHGHMNNGRSQKPNRHDILTGSTLDGKAFSDGKDHTCSDWSTNAGTGSAQVGHHDRTGGGQNPTSWNSAHGSRGCSQANLQATGGNGLFYCFAE